ncbi:MAG: 2-dehydropantoate 2-reductase N-terminal domain-containing protein [Thermodesulfobacteriota bacterium]
MTEKVLVIGSGAVGAVYAQALVKAGCRVDFLVRDRQSPNAAMPRTLFRYSLFGGYREERQDLETLTRADGHYDQVWLCTPSNALADSWLTGQIAAIDGSTPLIAWTPDIQDLDILRRFHPGPICQGLIALISFQSPLPGEQDPPPGIAYVPLPGSAVLQDDEHGRKAARWLKTGGMPAGIRKDLAWWEARTASVNICAMAALEQEGWSLTGLRRSPRLGLAVRAGREAAEAGAAYLGVSSGMFRYVPIGLILRTIMLVGPKLSPIPLETYLRYHFTKIGSQTRQILDAWIQRCRAHHLPHENLIALRQGL